MYHGSTCIEGSEHLCELHSHDGDCCIPMESWDNGIDSPANCSHCGRPINCSLTDAGIEYVYEYARRDLRRGWREYAKPTSLEWNPDWYYNGSPACAVTLDWLREILWTDPKAQRYADALQRGIDRYKREHPQGE